MIEAEGVTVSLGGKRILESVGITVPTGGVLGLVGPNGSGKTTLLRVLYRAIAPDAGAVRLDGAVIARLSRRHIARRIAVVPQERPDDSGQSLADMVMLGRLPHRSFLSGGRHADYEAATASIARVGLAGQAGQSFNSLSGGEAQRALIARALCQQADHLLLDEPTNHLDLRYQHEILALVRDLGLTTVIVLHDLNLAARYCDQIALLDRGRVVAFGTPQEVFAPQLLEPIYQVSTTRLERDSGAIHLIFAESSLSSQPIEGKSK